MAFAGVVSVVWSAVSYLSDRNSNTTFKVVGSDPDHVHVKVWNTGRKPSAIVGYRLRFDKLPKAKELTLHQFSEDPTKEVNVIAPGKDPVTMALGLPIRKDLPEPLRSLQYTDSELETLKADTLNAISAVVEIDVEESDDEGGYHLRRERINADRIDKFMGGLIH